jgi:hypothetical protein
MVESGEATKVVFESPKDVEGVFGFWYEPCEDSD